MSESTGGGRATRDVDLERRPRLRPHLPPL